MSASPTTAEAFVPTLDRARREGVVARAKIWFLPVATDLIIRPPAEQHAVAAVVLRARVERRHVRQRAAQLPEEVVSRLPREPDPLPRGFVDRRHRYLVARDPWVSDCEMCEIRRGHMPCGVCGGSGIVYATDAQGNQVRRKCSSCQDGFVTCTTCNGSGQAISCTVADVDDHQASLAYTYVPSMMLDLELAVSELLDPQVDPPPCLQVGFELKTARSAYRGATKQAEAKHLGHDYGAALDSARAAVRGLGLPGEFVGHDIEVYAWPILWMRYRGFGGRHDVALIVDPAGKLRAFAG